MWTALVLPLATALVASLVAWNHATRLDRQVQSESWPRHREPDGSFALAVGAVIVAVVAVTMLQMMAFPR